MPKAKSSRGGAAAAVSSRTRSSQQFVVYQDPESEVEENAAAPHTKNTSDPDSSKPRPLGTNLAIVNRRRVDAAANEKKAALRKAKVKEGAAAPPSSPVLGFVDDLHVSPVKGATGHRTGSSSPLRGVANRGVKGNKAKAKAKAKAPPAALSASEPVSTEHKKKAKPRVDNSKKARAMRRKKKEVTPAPEPPSDDPAELLDHLETVKKVDLPIRVKSEKRKPEDYEGSSTDSKKARRGGGSDSDVAKPNAYTHGTERLPPATDQDWLEEDELNDPRYMVDYVKREERSSSVLDPFILDDI